MAPYRDLRADRDRSADPTFICEGALCVARALSNGFLARSVLSTESQLAELKNRVGAERLAGCELITTSAQALREITGFDFHRGILADVYRPAPGVLPTELLKQRAQSTVVATEQVTNPANMGALIRNCRSFGVDGLLRDQSSADPFSRQAVRAAMGNSFSLPMWRTDSLQDSFKAWKASTGGEVWAAALTEDAVSLRETKRPAHLMVVMGSEGDGLLPETLSAADRRIVIPMSQGADSLNVAAASAVMLYALANV